MGLRRGFYWAHDQWQFTGYSLAGITTSIFCKNASVCFDVGQGLPFQIPARHILITHGHMDHASGIPYLASQKTMMGVTGTKIYMPESLCEPMRSILAIWEKIENNSFSCTIEPAKVGDFVALDKNFWMKPFATSHRLPSQGYILYEKKKFLRPELKEKSPQAILRIRHNGEDPHQYALIPVVAFTGDTRIEFVDSDPDIGKAKILFMEVTFWDDKKTVEETRRWGHIHLEEFLTILPSLKNEKIALIHSSARYSRLYLEDILAKRLNSLDQARVCLYPRIEGSA